MNIDREAFINTLTEASPVVKQTKQLTLDLVEVCRAQVGNNTMGFGYGMSTYALAEALVTLVFLADEMAAPRDERFSDIVNLMRQLWRHLEDHADEKEADADA